MSNPDTAPLAEHCSLCGNGYHPNLQIEIAEEPTEIHGELRYGWGHVMCQRDHDALFVEVFG